MRLVWQCTSKDTPFVVQDMFLLEADFFDRFSPGKLKSICSEYILKAYIYFKSVNHGGFI